MLLAESKEALAVKDAEIAALKAQVVAGKDSDVPPVKTGATPAILGERSEEALGSGAGQQSTFEEAAEALAKEKNITLHEAKSRVARKQPELYAAHKDALGL